MQVQIKGKVVGKGLKQPQNGQKFKPHQELQVLQQSAGRVELIKIKDYDLTREHKGDFVADCFVSSWAFRNESGELKKGLSVQVI